LKAAAGGACDNVTKIQPSEVLNVALSRSSAANT